MNYIDQAKWLLRHYAQLQTSITNMEEEHRRLYADLCPPGTTWNLDRVGDRSTLPRDMWDILEDVSRYPQLDQLKYEIKRTRALLAKIDRAMASLTPRERDILTYRYRQGWEWKEVADKVNMSERHCRRCAGRAALSVVVGIWGMKAVSGERWTQRRREEAISR